MHAELQNEELPFATHTLIHLWHGIQAFGDVTLENNLFRFDI